MSIEAAKKYETHFEDAPNYKAPSDIAPLDFLNALKEEFGIDIENIRNFLSTMEKMAVEKGKSVFTASQSEILNYCQDEELLSKKEALKVLKEFCLVPRNNWERPPSVYKARDIHPWLFRWRLSLLFKPYVKIDNIEDPAYIISPGLSAQTLVYFLGIYWESNIEEDRCRSKEMKKWIGKERFRKGHEFNKKVATTLEGMGYHAKHDVKVSSIISKKKADKDYGDVDVLAWKEGEKFIYLIECKDLYFAKNINEVAEQLLKFKGEIRNGKPDKLKKHMDRVAILSEYKADLLKFCEISNVDIEICSYVIFSNPVPMLYDSSIPKEVKFASIQEIIEEKTLC